MDRMRVVDALGLLTPQENVRLSGWVRTRRDAKGFSFLELNDGSCLANIQVIVDESLPEFSCMDRIHTGSSVAVEGSLVASPGKGQQWELRARSLRLFGEADPASYPLQKKRHSDEFLRGIAHLRPRTNKYGASLRIRSEAAFAIHEYFREQGYFYVHTPILTGSDCEGAGELFRINGDFFGRECSLTVSGQLEAEALAMGLGRVYTFGPTFRAEHSNTPRHAAEFWMIEPEAAFLDLPGLMDLSEDLTRTVVKRLLERCQADIDLFARFVDTDLPARLANVVDQPFVRIPYREAMDLLKKSGKDFEYPPDFGQDLQTEHERFLTEEHFRRPVMVFDWPKGIKSFYMRVNDDNETVAAMDMLVPRVGELIGGSQREERLDVLEARMRDLGQKPEDYWWYLDLRRFGSVPHAGFGLGFERLLMLVTGIANIRDVLPFPRTPGNLEF